MTSAWFYLRRQRAQCHNKFPWHANLNIRELPAACEAVLAITQCSPHSRSVNVFTQRTGCWRNKAHNHEWRINCGLQNINVIQWRSQIEFLPLLDAVIAGLAGRFFELAQTRSSHEIRNRIIDYGYLWAVFAWFHFAVLKFFVETVN